MDEDKWSDLHREVHTDNEAREIAESITETSAVGIGMTFLSGLDERAQYINALRNLTTPESWSAWGDFSEAEAHLKGIRNRGTTNLVEYAPGDPDVAYFKILSGVTTSFQVLEGRQIDIAAMLTMVWRDDLGGWRIHGMGKPIPAPDVPHGS